MNKLLSVVMSALCAAFVTGTALAADYTWTGGAENNVLTDGGNWSPKLPTTSNWADVGIIDGLPLGTVLSMGEDYTAPRLKFSNTPSIQLDLAGHKLSFGNNNNWAWSLSDCELTVTDSVGGGTNVFANNYAYSSLGVNSKLIYDGVAYTRLPTPTFPEDRSAELVFKNGTTAVFGQLDDGALGNYSRIVVDNATLSWLNNFSRNAGSITKGWTIVAQNNGTVTGNNYCYLGSSDVSDPIRFVATSGGKISMPSGVNRFFWQNGGFEAYCTNATIQLNGGNATTTYSSFGKFVCEGGEMKGLLSVRANNEIRFSGTCTALPSLSFAADAQDNDILFTNMTCAAVPINSFDTLGRGTNNTVRIVDSELSSSSASTPLNLFTSCGSSPSENSVVEFSGKKAALVSYGQSSKRSINIGQNSDAVAAEDRPHLRFKIPEGGFDDTPIRAEIKGCFITWDFNPVIEVVPDGVRYGDAPTYHPLIGFGEGGAGSGWTGARTPDTAANVDNLNEISADYLPHGAMLVVDNGTRKSVGVLLPERIVLSAEYASELGTVSAKLSLNREPDAEIHMVYGWENGGEDVDGWENDEVVESLEVGPVPGFGTSFLHLRFYTVNGDGTVSWSSAFAASDDPKLSEPTVDFGGNYVKISGVLEDAGIVSTTADITLAVAKADEEFGKPVTVKVGVRAGESFDRAVSGLDSATAYKFRLTATNEHGISTTVEGAFTTTGGSDYGGDPVVTWNGPLSVDSAATIFVPYDAPWGGDAAALVDVHAVWGFAEDALDHDVVVAAGTLGAGVGLLEDAKPGETYFVQLYAQSGVKTSDRTTVRSVQIPSESAVADSRSESTRNSYTVSGTVTPGVGLTRVWLRYSFNSDALDQSVLVCEKQIGDDPSFAYAFEPTQSGDTLHWQVVVSNDYASATWGDFAWGAKSETAATILTDTATVDWTWQTAGAGDWQEAGNWSAKEKTGFPNAAGAQALFTTATDGATAKLQDDVTLKLLKATGAKATVDGNGRLLTTAGITLALGPNGESPELTFANAAFGTNVKPTFPSVEGTDGQAKLIYRNSTATLAVGDWAQPAHSALIADGGSLNVSGNYSRWAAGGNLPDRLVAALNGARVTLGAFSHLGSDDPEQPHAFVATEGAWLAAGGGYNRTFLHANILVAVTNATLNMGSGNNRYAMGFADDSHFDLNGATLDCYWNLGHRSSAYVTGNCDFAGFGPQLMSNHSWNNTEDSARKGVFSSVDSEILVENARVTGANRLSYVYGTNSTIRIKDSIVTMNGQLNFAPNYGYGSRFIVDNSIITNSAHWVDFDVQTNVLGSALVLCGEAPRYVVTGNGSGVSCELGTDAAQTNPAEIRFVLPREGYAEAPIQFRSGRNGRIRAHLPIRVDATGYRKLRRYTMPLISMDQGWGVKATAEDIQANLPSDALPKGAKLVWVGKDLCLEMPSQGGFAITVR